MAFCSPHSHLLAVPPLQDTTLQLRITSDFSQNRMFDQNFHLHGPSYQTAAVRERLLSRAQEPNMCLAFTAKRIQLQTPFDVPVAAPSFCDMASAVCRSSCDTRWSVDNKVQNSFAARLIAALAKVRSKSKGW